MRSSTLSPKIQSDHRLPTMCSQPPCRNIDVTAAAHVKRAGTRPYAEMNWTACRSVSDVSMRKTTRLTAINKKVIQGVVREGMTSRRGNMGAGAELSDRFELSR